MPKFGHIFEGWHCRLHGAGTISFTLEKSGNPLVRLYALALTLYELLLGDLPWGKVRTMKYVSKLEGNIPNVCDKNPEIPKR